MIPETPRSYKYRLSRLARNLHDTGRPAQTAANCRSHQTPILVQRTLHNRD